MYDFIHACSGIIAEARVSRGEEEEDRMEESGQADECYRSINHAPRIMTKMEVSATVLMSDLK